MPSSYRRTLLRHPALRALAFVVGLGLAPAHAVPGTVPSVPPSAQPEVSQPRRAATVGEEFRNVLVEGNIDRINAMLALLSAASGSDTAAIPLAMQAAAEKRWDAASALLKRPVDRGDPNAAALRVWALHAAGKPDEAAAAVEALRTAAGPAGSTITAATAGVYYDHTGKLAEARKAYDEAARDGAILLGQAALQRVSFLVRQRDRDGAMKALEAQFGTADSDRVNLWRERVRTGQVPVPPVTPASAAAAYLVDIVNLLAYGQQMGMGSEAEMAANAGFNGFAGKATLLWSALAVDPGNIDARLAIAEQLGDLDEHEAAARVLLPVASESYAAVALARQEISLGLINQALARLDAIPEARRDRAWRGVHTFGLGASGRHAEAEAAWTAEIARIDAQPEAERSTYALAGSLLGRASMRLAQGKDADAEADIRRAREVSKGDATLLGDVGSLLSRREETRAEAIELLREARQKRPANPFIRAVLANALSKDDETKGEAVVLLRGLLSEDEWSPERMNQLGYTLVDQAIDLDEGFRLLREAHLRRPNSPAITDSYGKAHYQFGQFERARELMERAIELGREAPDVEMFDNLGDTYWRLGRQEEARAQWRKALAGDKAYAGRAALPGKIANGLTTPAPEQRPLPIDATPDARAT